VFFEMARNLELLELLNTLINTTEDNTMILNKSTLQSVLTCLQVTQAKVRLLQSLSQLLNDEIMDLKNQQPVKCSELVFVQHNPLYDDDDDDDDVFDQQSVKEKLSKTIPDADKDESIHEPTFQEFSFEFSEENLSMLQQHAVNPLPQISKQQVQNTLSKPIIRPWEEIIYNKNRTGLGYDKEVTFHIPDYSRPIKFQSVGFLQEDSLHLFKFNIIMMNANIAIELVTWRISVLISILSSIVASITILQTDVQH
jgi:hypothetical protein